MGEPPHRVHARLRRGGLAEQQRRHRRPAELPAAATSRSRRTASRSTPDRRADLLRREPRRATRSSTRSSRSSTTTRQGATDQFTRYKGTDGVGCRARCAGPRSRCASATSNLLISGQINAEDARSCIERDIRDRVKKPRRSSLRRRPVPGRSRNGTGLDARRLHDDATSYPYSQSLSRARAALGDSRSTTSATR